MAVTIKRQTVPVVTVPDEAEILLRKNEWGEVCFDLSVNGVEYNLAFMDRSDGSLQLQLIPVDERAVVGQYVRLDANGYWQAVA